MAKSKPKGSTKATPKKSATATRKSTRSQAAAAKVSASELQAPQPSVRLLVTSTADHSTHIDSSGAGSIETEQSDVESPPPIPPTKLKAARAATHAYLMQKSQAQGPHTHDGNPTLTEYVDSHLSRLESEDGSTSGEEELEVDELDPSDRSTTASESEDAPFVLPFSVPVGGANETFNVSSDGDFGTLRNTLADLMEIAPKQVSVAYRFNVPTKSEPWKHLKSTSHLEELFVSAADVIEKRVKTKSTRNFLVELKDLRENAEKNLKGGIPKKVAKDRRHNAPKKGGNTSDGSMDSTSAEKPKKRSVPQWVAVLETDNRCDVHQKACLKFGDHHHTLTKQELGAWGIFLSNGYTSTTVPPPAVKIGDAETKARGQKTPAALPAMGSPAPPQTPHSTLSYHSPFSHPMPFYPPYPMFDPYARDRDYYRSPPPKRRYDEIPSSDGIEESVEDPSIFPLVATWLEGLDSGPRGNDGHGFGQYTGALVDAKIIRVSDIADSLSVGSLQELANGMPLGTAAAMLRYAEADTKRIRDHAQKRKVSKFREPVAGPSRRQY